MNTNQKNILKEKIESRINSEFEKIFNSNENKDISLNDFIGKIEKDINTTINTFENCEQINVDEMNYILYSSFDKIIKENMDKINV